MAWADFSLEMVSNTLEHVISDEPIFYTPVFRTPGITYFLDSPLLSVGKLFLTERQLYHIISGMSSKDYHFIVREHTDLFSLAQNFAGKISKVTIQPDHLIFVKQDERARIAGELAIRPKGPLRDWPPVEGPALSANFLSRRWNLLSRIEFACQLHAKITLELFSDFPSYHAQHSLYGDLNKARLYIENTASPRFRHADTYSSADLPHMAPGHIMCHMAARNERIHEVMRALMPAYIQNPSERPSVCIFFEMALISSPVETKPEGIYGNNIFIAEQIARFETKTWSVHFNIGDEEHEVPQAGPMMSE
jgi:hypothetical protein